MNPKDNPLYSFRYKIEKKDIEDFVNSLHAIQSDYIEQAVEKSGYKDAKDANEAIKRIMEIK